MVDEEWKPLSSLGANAEEFAIAAVHATELINDHVEFPNKVKNRLLVEGTYCTIQSVREDLCVVGEFVLYCKE